MVPRRTTSATGAIATNTADIATNVSNIATNVTNIAATGQRNHDDIIYVSGVTDTNAAPIFRRILSNIATNTLQTSRLPELLTLLRLQRMLLTYRLTRRI